MLQKLSALSLFCVAALVLAASPALAITEVFEDNLDFSEYVASGDSFEFQHTFDPFFDDDIVISSVDSAWLYVALVDDANCRRLTGCLRDWFVESEVAAIDLNSVEWATGSATATILWGDVTAEADLLNNNGILDVRVTSDHGDFVVLWSNLVTTYTYELAGNTVGGASGSSPMPEPSAALAFAIGALVMRGTVRRRRSG